MTAGNILRGFIAILLILAACVFDAQDLLSLCGPCIERDNAQATLDSKLANR